MRRFLRPRTVFSVLGLLAGLLGTAAPAHATVTVSLTNDVALAEGNAGTTAFHFNLHAVNNDGANPSVAGSVLVTTADGTAVAGGAQPNADYVGRSFTQVIPVIAAGGVFDADVQVDVNGDITFEPNENFTLNISNPSNVLLGTASRTGTILNDDSRPDLVFNDPAPKAEGNSGSSPYNFTLSLTNPTFLPVSVNATTIVGSATSAGGAPGNPDYTEILDQTFTIPAGSTSVTIPVSVIGDLVLEPDENFGVRITNVTNVFTAVNPLPGGVAQATGVITNDDVDLTLSINNPSKAEGNSGSSPLNFTVSIPNPAPTGGITFRASTIVGTATSSPAGPGNPDYAEILNQLFTIPAGSTSVTVPVTIFGDTTFEGNETFAVRITNPTNGGVIPGGVAQGTGTINNDDTAPTFSISALATVLCETDNPIQITVTLSEASGLPATVTLTDNTGTAQDPADFTLQPKVLNFAPGETVKTATLTPVHDNLVEGSETIIIVANPTTGVTGPAQVLPTITLNDPDSLNLNLVQISGDSLISINGISQQCFRVTVTDGCGDPFANQTVTFHVNGTTGNNQDVDVLLDNAGVGEFCFTPVFPGSDEIFVTADNGLQTFVSNTIDLDFTVAPNTRNASVTGAGVTDAAEAAGPTGLFSFFSVDVKNLRNGRTQGSVNGTLPVLGAITLRSLKMTNLVAGQGQPDGKRALAFGTAKLIVQVGGPGNGIRTVQAPVLIRVDALDNGLPGVPNDRFEVTFLVDQRQKAGRNAVAGGVLPGGTFTAGGNVEHGNNGAKGDIRIVTGLAVGL